MNLGTRSDLGYEGWYTKSLVTRRPDSKFSPCGVIELTKYMYIFLNVLSFHPWFTRSANQIIVELNILLLNDSFLWYLFALIIRLA